MEHDKNKGLFTDYIIMSYGKVFKECKMLIQYLKDLYCSHDQLLRPKLVI